jgi:hypothetical protein
MATATAQLEHLAGVSRTRKAVIATAIGLTATGQPLAAAIGAVVCPLALVVHAATTLVHGNAAVRHAATGGATGFRIAAALLVGATGLADVAYGVACRVGRGTGVAIAALLIECATRD